MPTELEDLVEFIHHGNTPIRQLAVENLVPYSLSQPAIFKKNQLLPVRELKLLIRDYADIAKDAITILINLSTDREVLEELAADDKFLESLLTRLTNPTEASANLLSMLLANLAKSDSLKRILSVSRPAPPTLSSSTLVIDQLLDIFVKGADGAYNKEANFDYLSYLFADLAKHTEGRAYFAAVQTYDGVIPLSKLIVFTEHKSNVRRKGVASTIKNVAFDIPSHPAFLDDEKINVLPYLLLPITGNEEFDEEDMLDMLPDLQLLPPDKTRDTDASIIHTHVETLMLLTTTREGRDTLRAIKVYPIVRETHLHTENEEVREACEKLVQVLMRDEEGGATVDDGMKALSRSVRKESEVNTETHLQAAGGPGSWAKIEEVESEEEEDDDDKIVDV